MNDDKIPIHEEKFNKKKIELINFLSFAMGFSQALLAYITSTYFKEALGMENIGIFYIAAYLVVLAALFNFHKLVKKIGKSYVFFASFIIKLISLLFLVTLPPSSGGAIFLVLHMIFGALEVVALDIILESFSVDKMSGRVRGVYLTLLDAGFILGPLLSTSILENFGFKGVFIISLVINIFILLIGFFGLSGVNHKFDKRLTVGQLLKKTWQRPNIKRIYCVSFVLESFYAIMIIFMPIYLRDLGMDWQQIGVIFTLMLIPFLLLPFPVGWLADTKLGEKEMIFFALLIMGSATFLIYFINSAAMLPWIVALFTTRIGAAALQTLRDSYFYKRIDGRDVDLIDFFRTAMPAAYIFSMLASTIILIFFPLKIIFIFLAALIILGLYPTLRLKDNL